MHVRHGDKKTESAIIPIEQYLEAAKVSSSVVWRIVFDCRVMPSACSYAAHRSQVYSAVQRRRQQCSHGAALGEGARGECRSPALASVCLPCVRHPGCEGSAACGHEGDTRCAADLHSRAASALSHVTRCCRRQQRHRSCQRVPQDQHHGLCPRRHFLPVEPRPVPRLRRHLLVSERLCVLGGAP